ncbi:MAG: hypothetical protein LBG78_01850 [Azoarcus sp.]|jgi:hypothetical protein|nr:hypothetical protein [Azoarcus sp.]
MNATFLKLLAAVLLPSCLVWNIAQSSRASAAPDPTSSIVAAIEWPTQWRGLNLRPLALSPVERRFAQGFPGKTVRLTNDRDEIIWRAIARPTRLLHPAADCYKALGWRIADEHLEQIENERWRCFTARREGSNLRVCERIEDASGISFTDASAWYWSAVTGQSVGPWQAMTVASPM